MVEDDEGFVFESAGICLHLADLHPEAGLIPKVGTHDRALVYQWTLYGMTELEAPIVDWFRTRETNPEQAEAAAERVRAAAAVVEQALARADSLVGGRFTVADVVVGGVLAFARGLELLSGVPRIDAYLARLEERPARQRALAVTAA